MSAFQKIENKDEWGSLLDKVFFKTFFHTLEWESFLEKEFFWMKFERYVWRDVLLLSVARCRLFGREKLVSHPFCEYGGPLLIKAGVEWEAFLQDFIKFFGDKAKIKFHPYILQNYRGLTPIISGSDPSILTFWIEDYSKKSPEDLWGSFRKTMKQEIKKGEGLVSVKECESEDKLKQFYNLYLCTVKRHKNIPLPFSVFRFLLNGSGSDPAPRGQTPDSWTKIFLAKHKGKVVGGSAFLFYPPFIHYFISASDERFRDLNIGHQILWHVMQKYVGHRKSHIQYDYFDLGGTKKGSALEVFKRGWGAKEYPIWNIGTNTRGIRSQFMRNMLPFIPKTLMKQVSPIALWTKI